jgi:hypothetical protein
MSGEVIRDVSICWLLFPCYRLASSIRIARESKNHFSSRWQNIFIERRQNSQARYRTVVFLWHYSFYWWANWNNELHTQIIVCLSFLCMEDRSRFWATVFMTFELGVCMNNCELFCRKNFNFRRPMQNHVLCVVASNDLEACRLMIREHTSYHNFLDVLQSHVIN